MILTNEQLRATLRGAVEIVERDGVLHPYRFGAHLRNEVYGAGNPYHAKTFHTSGIVSTFRTDSATLGFSFAVSTAAASQSFDVCADGVLISHTPTESATGRIEVALGAGEKTVTIYFPYCVAGRIFDVTLADGASLAAAPDAAHRILFIGDSITHGCTAYLSSMTYPNQLARALNAEIVNQGIGGAGFEPTAVDECAGEFDLISVAYGTNDWSHAPSHTHLVGMANGHLAALRDRYPHTPIALILPIWRADNHLLKATGTFDEMRRVLTEAAARFGVTVIDGLTLVPHLRSVMADDRLHPNSFGFQFYAESLVPHFERILGK